MKIVAQTLFESNQYIVDADVSQHMIAVLLKGKGECIVSINHEDVFTVSSQMYMLRIVGAELVLYDGQELFFLFIRWNLHAAGDNRSSCAAHRADERCRRYYI